MTLIFKRDLFILGSDWREDSAIKCNDCSFREPRFNAQHPEGSSQPSVTPALGDLTLSCRPPGPRLEFGTRETQASIYAHAYAYTDNTNNFEK